jgi:hypothetical protein
MDDAAAWNEFDGTSLPPTGLVREKDQSVRARELAVAGGDVVLYTGTFDEFRSVPVGGGVHTS